MGLTFPGLIFGVSASRERRRVKSAVSRGNNVKISKAALFSFVYIDG